MEDFDRGLLIIVIISIIIVIGFIILISWASNEQNKDREIVCKEIGLKNNYKFLFQSNGRCGWGETCLYQCRFVNQNGKMVIQNVN